MEPILSFLRGGDYFRDFIEFTEENAKIQNV